MSRSPFFSIIIPVYNAETTLENTIASIQAQKCSDFEVLCINDASTDHTKQIGQKLCDKDNRIHWMNRKRIWARELPEIEASRWHRDDMYILWMQMI